MRGGEAGRERRIAGNALATAGLQVATMALGAVLAVFIVLKFGKNARTDGLFAAYGVYGFILLLAQSMRVTIVARLVEGPSVFAAVDRFLGAALAIALASSIPFLVLGGPIAGLLVGDLGSDASETTQNALAILWLAAAAQLLAGLAAAALGTRDDFAVPGFAYLAGGLVPPVLVVALGDRLGIQSVTIGLALGSLVTVLIMFARLVSFGYRPRLGSIAGASGRLSGAYLILGGSFGYLIAQLAYVITLGFAARMSEGAVTLYSYAFFTASLLIGASSGPVSYVLAAPLSETWDRRPESLRGDLLAVVRTGFATVLPVLAAAALVGRQVVDVVLGASLSSSDSAILANTFLALGGMILSSQVAPVPTIAAFAASRYAHLALISVVGLALHTGLNALAFSTRRLEVLGGATSVSTLFSLLLLLLVVYGRQLGGTLDLLGRELARVALVAAAAFGPPWVFAALVDDREWNLLAAFGGLVLYVLLLRRVLPEHWVHLQRVVGPLGRGRSTAAPEP